MNLVRLLWTTTSRPRPSASDSAMPCLVKLGEIGYDGVDEFLLMTPPACRLDLFFLRFLTVSILLERPSFSGLFLTGTVTHEDVILVPSINVVISKARTNHRLAYAVTAPPLSASLYGG